MCPHSLAVIGASNKEHTIGSDIMKRLVEYGFTGKIFPINPKDSEIQGMKAYPSVLEVPEEIDMAVIVINAKYVLSAVDQCHRKGIKGIVVISAGFKETGAAGAELELASARTASALSTQIRNSDSMPALPSLCPSAAISASSPSPALWAAVS